MGVLWVLWALASCWWALVAVVDGQAAKKPTIPTYEYEEHGVIYHPINETKLSRCWPLKVSLCSEFQKQNPWLYEDFLEYKERTDSTHWDYKGEWSPLLTPLPPPPPEASEEKKSSTSSSQDPTPPSGTGHHDPLIPPIVPGR